MFLQNQVSIQKRIYESPINVSRFNDHYRFKNALSTADKKYSSIPLLFNGDYSDPEKPLDQVVNHLIEEDDNEAFYYYLFKFSIDDFGLFNKKISVDLSCDDHGNLYLAEEDAVRVASTSNILKDPFLVIREPNKTLHLQDKFEELAELLRRGYKGNVWVIVADYCEF